MAPFLKSAQIYLIMNVLRDSRSMTVSNIVRVPRINVFNSQNALFVEVESRLYEYRLMPAK